MNLLKYSTVLLAFIFSIICLAFGGTYDISDESEVVRHKRQHGHGITGPVHTFVKTDKHANFKWGVRHHVGHKYAGRR